MVTKWVHQLGSSAYRMAKTSLVENFKHRWKNDMAINMATLFAREVLWKLSLLGNLKPLDKKVGLEGGPT